MIELPQVVCPDCKMEFASRDEYMAHRQSPCVNLQSPEQPKLSAYYSAFKVTNTGQYKCMLCSRYFDTYSAMGFHLSKVHDIRMTDEERAEYSRRKAKAYYNENVRKKPVIKPKPIVTPIIVQPTIVPPVEQKNETAKLIIKFCSKCKTIWDGVYEVKFCPDCGTELQEPLKRKTFKVVQ